jgi:hypothetical protein
MPALPVVPNVVKAQFGWNDGSDTHAMNVLHFRYSGGPPTSTDCTSLASSLFTAMAGCHGNWPAGTLLELCQVTDLASPSGGQGAHTGAQDGISSGTALAAGSATLVNYIIGRRYRGGKPRSYFPWGDSASLASRQNWTAAFISQVSTTLSSAFAAMLGASAGSTVITAHVNVSYYQGNKGFIDPNTGIARNIPQLRATPVVDTINSFKIGPTVASQRRRNFG